RGEPSFRCRDPDPLVERLESARQDDGQHARAVRPGLEPVGVSFREVYETAGPALEDLTVEREAHPTLEDEIDLALAVVDMRRYPEVRRKQGLHRPELSGRVALPHLDGHQLAHRPEGRALGWLQPNRHAGRGLVPFHRSPSVCASTR